MESEQGTSGLQRRVGMAGFIGASQRTGVRSVDCIAEEMAADKITEGAKCGEETSKTLH